MAGVSVTFSAVDEISARFEAMANAGENALNSFDKIQNSANEAANAMENVRTSTDYWTEAVGNYDKSAMEAIYSTEELVEMGYKAAEALEEEERMFELCEQSSQSLDKAMESSVSVQSELSAALEKVNENISELTNNENISSETMHELEKSSVAAMDAMKELTAAQEEATAAMENYDTVMKSSTANLDELEAAAERVMHAAENLAEANSKAADAEEELAKASEKAGGELENAGKSGVDAVNEVATVLASAGIAASIKEIAAEAYELVNVFSEAEQTVVLATGATGEALESLERSMMNVNASAKSTTLSNTASAIGEINTRLGLTGKELEKVTDLFLDYANATGGNVSSSVRTVTQLMNQWGIELDGLDGLLDKLTFAGQVSGISIDALTSELTTNKAILDQLGFSLDEAIAMFCNFELAGTSSTSVMTGFRSALASGTISSLEDLYDIFEQITYGAIDASEASGIFGQRAGTQIVNAVNTGVLSLDDMVNMLQRTDGTLKTTAEAAQTLDERWQQANNNISAAFTSVMEPVISKISAGMADGMNHIGDFLNEHPAVTKAITVIGTGLGTMAVGIGSVSIATKVAIPLIKSLAVSTGAAIWPITAIAAGVAAVTAAVIFFTDIMDDNVNEYDTWTNATRKQYDELKDLTGEYENAVDIYGETSAEAILLKEQINNLTDSFEGSKQTIEEFYNELDKTCDAHDEIVKSFNDTSTQIKTQESGTVNLVNKLKELSETTEMTVGTQEQMKAIVDLLNESYPELGLNINDVTDSIDDMINKINSVSNANNMQEKYENAAKTYASLVAEQTALQEACDEAYQLYLQAGEKYVDAGVFKGTWSEIWGTGVAKEAEEAEQAYERAEQAVQENLALQQECIDTMTKYQGVISGTSEEMVSFEDATAIALAGVKDSLQKLAEEYDAQYQAAYNSIDGQIGLFQKMKTESEQSVAEMQAALQSQIEYINRYTENLEKASQYNLNDSLISKLSDGSAESAGQLDAIIKKIEELGGTTEGMSTEAQAFIDSFNSSFEQVTAAKETFSNTVAGMETDFSEKMDAINQELQTSINKMNMADDAALAASDTLNSYINTIKSKVPEVNSALEAIKFSNSNVEFTMPVAHAEGGIFDEPHYGVFAEDGPEAFIPIDGSQNAVNIWKETGRQLGMYQEESNDFYVAPFNGSSSEQFSESENKIITLKLEGSGEMHIGNNGISKEQVLSVLMENVKGVLMNIVQQEILEEGELSYEY